MRSGTCTPRTSRRWALPTKDSAGFVLPTNETSYPTPAATQYGSSQNGINGVGGDNERPSAGTPSLETMARKGMFPTPLAACPDRPRSVTGERRRSDLALTALEMRHGHYPTPTAQVANNQAGEGQGRRNTLPLDVVAVQTAASWPTAVARDGRSNARHTTKTGVMHSGTTLTDAMRDHMDAMQTSQSSPPEDMTSGPGPICLHPTPSSPQHSRAPKIERDASGKATMILNVLFVEHLMGLPIGWTGLEPVGMASYRSWLATHSSILVAVLGCGERVADNPFVQCVRCRRIVKGKPVDGGMRPNRHKDDRGKWCCGTNEAGEYVDWEAMRA